MDLRGTNIVNKLFNRFKEAPESMPQSTFDSYKMAIPGEALLVIADYISGMTDRYALETYNSIFGLPSI